MAEMDDDELLDALGIEVAPLKASSRTPREERIITGFEDIQRFVEQNKRIPQHGESRDIFERLYAVRLDRLKSLPDCRALLEPLDTQGLLSGRVSEAHPPYEIDDDALLSELGADAASAGITELKHVRSSAEKRAAEDVARRTPCTDFERFKPLFDEALAGLKSGAWITKPFIKNASIEKGDFFIVGGQTSYVAEIHDGSKTKDGRDNPRLRVIFDNQTEGDLLLRSLSRSLYPDGDAPVGRRLIKRDDGPLFSNVPEPDDIESGTIYVLRSKSSHPFIAEHRDLIHKIGVTGGKVETRIASTEVDATYLLAGVEVVATYKLSNINRVKLEGLFHRIFSPAQIDVIIEDRFGNPVKPREWFLVPLQIIDEAVERIRNGSITKMAYDPKSASLVEI